MNRYPQIHRQPVSTISNVRRRGSAERIPFFQSSGWSLIQWILLIGGILFACQAFTANAHEAGQPLCPEGFIHEANWLVNFDFETTGQFVELQIGVPATLRTFCHIVRQGDGSPFIGALRLEVVMAYENLPQIEEGDSIDYTLIVSSDDTTVTRIFDAEPGYAIPEPVALTLRVWDWSGIDIDYDGEPIIILTDEDGLNYAYLPSGQIAAVTYSTANG